jgi:hypothetical protein
VHVVLVEVLAEVGAEVLHDRFAFLLPAREIDPLRGDAEGVEAIRVVETRARDELLVLGGEDAGEVLADRVELAADLEACVVELGIALDSLVEPLEVGGEEAHLARIERRRL